MSISFSVATARSCAEGDSCEVQSEKSPAEVRGLVAAFEADAAGAYECPSPSFADFDGDGDF